MNLTEVKDLKKGDRVKCKLNTAEEHSRWFEGVISDITYQWSKDRVRIGIDRDGGMNNWRVSVHKNNAKFIELLEWDNEFN